MDRRIISILSVFLFSLLSSVALSEDVREGLDEKEIPSSSGLEVLSPKEVIEPKVVESVPVTRSVYEENLLEDLNKARHAGDRDAARAFQLELDALHGILPNTSQSAGDEQEEVIFEDSSQGPQPLSFRWVDGDIRINDSSYDVVNPAMGNAPNGDLYVAMEDRDDDTIRVYKSTDGGVTWSSFLTLYSLGNDNRNPSIAVTGNYVHVAYEVWYSDTDRAVRVYSKPTDGSSGHGAWVVQNVADTPDFICPEICTDSLEFPGDTYVYVTYAVRTAYPYYNHVYFSRSDDDGQTFSAPVNVTGGTSYTAWETKPDIAFGTNANDLFIAFVKPGFLTTSDHVDEVVYVTKSANYGSSWGTPVQLTDIKKSYRPRVSAAHDSNSVVVTYTYQYSLTDEDVCYHYSTDAGATWNGQYSLSSSPLNENNTALSVSNSMGRFHAAYSYDEHDIRYESASTSTPNTWSSGQLINERSYASLTYPRPTITVNPTMPEADEACIAWTDYRSTYYDIYFDSASLEVGDDTIGLYDGSTAWVHLRNSNSTGVADIEFFYGPGANNWIPVTGDWNGDGVDTIGLYDQATAMFHLRNSHTTGAADISFYFGPGGTNWKPIAGDWNGDGIDTIGLYDASSAWVHLRNSNTTGGADNSFFYGPGANNWVPVAGDWNGDGVDSIGLYDQATAMFHLRNSHTTGVADISFYYGPGGTNWKPIVGDWDADGDDTIGLYDASSAWVHLRNSNTTGGAHNSFFYGPGANNWVPVAGDWDNQ